MQQPCGWLPAPDGSVLEPPPSSGGVAAAMTSSGYQWVDTSGFPTPPWLHLVGLLPQVTSRKVKLALPCIGLDALGWGLHEAGWESYGVNYAYDIDMRLAPALRQLYGEQVSTFHLGPDGDLLKADVRSWSRVDFVVTGPPCPPFSKIGQRLADPGMDPREGVFKKVTDCIVHQGFLGCWGVCVGDRARDLSPETRWHQLSGQLAVLLARIGPNVCRPSVADAER